MDQQQASQPASQQSSQQGPDLVPRPAVMYELTATQMFELQNQFFEGDRAGFDWRAESFGWTREQADQVWGWFEATRRALQELAAQQGNAGTARS